MAIFLVNSVINKRYDDASKQLEIDDDAKFKAWLDDVSNEKIVGKDLFAKAKQLYESLKPYRHAKYDVDNEYMEKENSTWRIDDPNKEFGPALAGDIDAEETALRFYQYLLTANVSKKMFYLDEHMSSWSKMSDFVNESEEAKAKQATLYKTLTDKLAANPKFLIDCGKANYARGDIIKINIGGTAFAYPMFVKIKEGDLRGIYVLKVFIEPTSEEGKALLKPYQMGYKEGEMFTELNDRAGDNDKSLMHMVRGVKLSYSCEHKDDETLNIDGIKRIERKRSAANPAVIEEIYEPVNYKDFITKNCPFSAKETIVNMVKKHNMSGDLNISSILSGSFDARSGREYINREHEKEVTAPGPRLPINAGNIILESMELEDYPGKLRLINAAKIKTMYSLKRIATFRYTEANINKDGKAHAKELFDQLVGTDPNHIGLVNCLGDVVVMDDTRATKDYETLLSYVGKIKVIVEYRFGKFNNETTQDEVIFGAPISFSDETNDARHYAKGDKLLTFTIKVDIMPGYSVDKRIYNRDPATPPMNYYGNSILCTDLKNPALGTKYYNDTLFGNLLAKAPYGALVHTTASYDTDTKFKNEVDDISTNVISKPGTKITFDKVMYEFMGKHKKTINVVMLISDKEIMKECLKDAEFNNAFNELVTRLNVGSDDNLRYVTEYHRNIIELRKNENAYSIYEYNDAHRLVTGTNSRLIVDLSSNIDDHKKLFNYYDIITSKHQKYINLAKYINGTLVISTKEEKKHRFCNESVLQRTSFKATYALMEYLGGGDFCSNIPKMSDRELLGVILQLMFQISALYSNTKFDMYHGDLHVNNVLFGLDQNYEPGKNKFYRYTYLDHTRQTQRYLYIPVRPKIVKIIDFDKSYFVTDAREKVLAVVNKLIKKGKLYTTLKKNHKKTAFEKKMLWRSQNPPGATPPKFKDDKYGRTEYILSTKNMQKRYDSFVKAAKIWFASDDETPNPSSSQQSLRAKHMILSDKANNKHELTGYVREKLENIYIGCSDPSRPTKKPVHILTALKEISKLYVDMFLIGTEASPGELGVLEEALNDAYDTNLVDGAIVAKAKDKLRELILNDKKILNDIIQLRTDELLFTYKTIIGDDSNDVGTYNAVFQLDLNNFKPTGANDELQISKIKNYDGSINPINLLFRVAFGSSRSFLKEVIDRFVLNESVEKAMKALINTANVSETYTPFIQDKFIISEGDFSFFLASLMASLDPQYANKMRVLGGRHKNESQGTSDKEVQKRVNKFLEEFPGMQKDAKTYVGETPADRGTYHDELDTVNAENPNLDADILAEEAAYANIDAELSSLVEPVEGDFGGDNAAYQSALNVHNIKKRSKLVLKENIERKLNKLIIVRERINKLHSDIARAREMLDDPEKFKNKRIKEIKSALMNNMDSSLDTQYIKYFSSIISRLSVEQYCRTGDAHGPTRDVSRIVRLLDNLIRCTLPVCNTKSDYPGGEIESQNIGVDYKKYVPGHEVPEETPADDDVGASAFYESKLAEAKREAVRIMATDIIKPDGAKYTHVLHEHNDEKTGLYGGAVEMIEVSDHVDYKKYFVKMSAVNRVVAEADMAADGRADMTFVLDNKNWMVPKAGSPTRRGLVVEHPKVQQFASMLKNGTFASDIRDIMDTAGLNDYHCVLRKANNDWEVDYAVDIKDDPDWAVRSVGDDDEDKKAENIDWLHGDPYSYLDILDKVLKDNKFDVIDGQPEYDPVTSKPLNRTFTVADNVSDNIIDAIDLTKYDFKEFR
jgi:hypothetical protein